MAGALNFEITHQGSRQYTFWEIEDVLQTIFWIQRSEPHFWSWHGSQLNKSFCSGMHLIISHYTKKSIQWEKSSLLRSFAKDSGTQ